MVVDAAASWELGSDFQTVDESFLSDEASPPWEHPGGAVTYFESGRQALGALSRRLRDAGRTRLVMPDYFCESMIDPFLRDGWVIEFAKVTIDFRIQPMDASDAGRETVVMSLPYFGAPESLEWLETLATMQMAGVVVISDETHRVLDGGLDTADFRVASLRKMLPLPDGAFVAGDLGPVPRSPARVASSRWEAMESKAAFLAGRPAADFRRGFAAAEELTDVLVEPAEMSGRSRDLIRHLDYAGLATARLANSEALIKALESTEYEPAQRDVRFVPSHLVITGPDVLGLRAHLIAERVFCPIHWPAPAKHFRSPGPWPSNYLSVPIDHRYCPDDLTKVGQLIGAFAAR